MGERADVTSRRQEAQVALWCSEEMKNSCHVGEKPYLCHVYGDFSPKGHGVIRNKKTKLKKNPIAISVSSASRGKLMKGDVSESSDLWEGKEWLEGCGGTGPEAEGCTKQEIWAGTSESQEAGDKQQETIFL